ncbi:MAG TPA: nucleotide disphospho-sugar-binding domain-containing protein [Rugosimonospora sp.]|nr:nucleotide disphospho-sugar-binding domain-containing protein [Rugosimonospora sp.]
MTTWSWATHFYPVVPIGWALRAAGHEVRVACPPGFASVVAGSGLTPVPVGADVDAADFMYRQPRAADEGSPDEPVEDRRAPSRLRRAVATITACAENIADDMVEFARQWRPDLIIHEPMGYAGPIVAQVLGVPAVRVLWALDISELTRPAEQELLAPLAARFGLDAVDTYSPVTIDPNPVSLRTPSPGEHWPVRYVPHNGPGVVPDWLFEPPQRPRVCVTWGTSLAVIGGNSMFHAPVVVDVLADMDAEVVVAVEDSHRQYFGNLPPNVRHVGRLPLDPLFAGCAAVVHQSGGGTMMNALVHGLPQVLVPHVPDQVYYARRIEPTGAASHLLASRLDTETLRGQIDRMLHEQKPRAAAESIRDEMRGFPTPSDLVDRLVALT